METFLSVSVILFIISSTSSVNATKCHSCGGAENIPKFARDTLNKLNISTGSLYGDCQKTSGSDMCSNGTFCIKRAKVYQIGYSGITLKWTSYTKGCATLREDNDGVPTSTCYDLGQVSNSSGYTARRVDCYCNKDFCNSTPLLSTISALIMMALLALSSI